MSTVADQTASQEINRVFDELIARGRHAFRDRGTVEFSGATRAAWYRKNLQEAEHAIWLIVSVRCEILTDGFTSVFEQLLTRDEALEFIILLRAYDLQHEAELFEQAIAVVDSINLYDSNGESAGPGWIEGEPGAELERIGNKVRSSNALWTVDQILLDRWRSKQ